MINYTIKVKAVLTGQTKTFDTLCSASKSTGVSEHLIKRIRKEQISNLVRGKGDKLFEFTFTEKDIVVTLSPAWDTSYDDVPIMAKSFCSHEQAINYLSEGGSYQCKKATYNRRRNMQPLGEPCSKVILDCWNRPWIATFYSKGEFIPNKR